MGNFDFSQMLNGGARGFQVGMASGNPLIAAASTFAGALQGGFMGDERAGMGGNPGGASMGQPGLMENVANLGKMVQGAMPQGQGQQGQQIIAQPPMPMQGPTEPIISMGGMPEQVEKSSILRKNMLGMRGPRDPFMRA